MALTKKDLASLRELIGDELDSRLSTLPALVGKEVDSRLATLPVLVAADVESRLVALPALVAAEVDSRLVALPALVGVEVDSKLETFREEVKERFDHVDSALDALFKRDETREQEYLAISEQLKRLEQ